MVSISPYTKRTKGFRRAAGFEPTRKRREAIAQDEDLSKRNLPVVFVRQTPYNNRMHALELTPVITDSRRPLLDVSSEELLSWLHERGQTPMRARQIQRWLFGGRAETFAQMSDLPKRLREELDAAFRPFGSASARRLVSSDGTHKLLLRLHDGQVVECVLLQEAERRTVCISTQVGCGMGCVFCASGIGGVVRNLTGGEILEQLLHARNLLPSAERLTHIVVMGMGEPLANLDALLEALALATAPRGLGIGARHITISTVGLPNRMRQLADLGKQYHLAVSLHAPNDELRTRIVPTNDKTGLTAILDAADYFQATTGRQVTYEYVLLRDVNDQPAHAGELTKLLRGRQAHVNLIPFNDVEGLPYRRLTPQALEDFIAILRGGGISVKVRKRKGADIDAACGQLRRAALAEPYSIPGVE
jgi:23S rRNA (adenine2503-C2)-methyltransferase